MTSPTDDEPVPGATNETAPPEPARSTRWTRLRARGPRGPRRRRLRRALLAISTILTLLFVALTAGLWWAATSEAGTRWAVRTASSLSHGALKVGSVRGTLARELELVDVRYASEGTTFTAGRLAFAWHPRALLSRRLDVDRFEADAVALVSTSEKKKKEPTQLQDIHLPVNVIVRDAKVNRLEMSGPGPEPPFVIDTIDLATSSRGDTVHLSRLAVRSPTFLLDASGDLTPLGDYPVNLRLSWFSVREDGSPLSGTGALTGTLERLKVTHELTAPVVACLDATLTHPMRELKFDGGLELDGVRLKDADPALPDAVVGGRVQAKGETLAFTAAGDLLVSTGEVPPVAARFDVQRKRDEWLLRAVELSVPRRPGGVSLEGRVSLAEKEPRFSMKGEWKNLAWPLAPPSGTAAPAAPVLAKSARGNLSVEGTASDYGIELTADLAGKEIPPGTWSLKGRGDRERLKLEWVRSSILGGSLAGSGTLSWKPEVRWQLALSGDGLDPSALAPDWSGRVAFAAATSGTQGARGLVARVEVSKLEGTLRGQPVSGRTLVELNGDETFIRRLDLKSGSATIGASGKLGREWALSFKVNAPNLAALVPRSSGELVAEGKVNGPGSALGVAATFSGKSLALDTNRIASLSGKVDVNLGKNGPLALEVEASGLKYEDRTVEALHVSGNGTRARHRIALSATGAVEKGDKGQPRSLDVVLDGGLDGKRWRGTLARLDLAAPETGTWKLDAPANLTAAADAIDLAGFRWSSGDAHLAANAAWSQAGPTKLDARLDRLPLSLLSPFLPASTKLTGTLDGHAIASATNAPGSLVANVELRPSPGEIRYPAPEGKEAVVAYKDGAFVLKAGGGNMGARGGVAIADGRLDFDVAVSGNGDVKSRPLTGTIRAQFPDLAFAQAFVPGTWQVSGALGADMKLAGTAGRPRVIGEAALSRGKASVPEYGLELRDIALTARGREDGHLVVDGSVRSGAGKATLAGDVDLAPGAPSKLAIRGERFQVMHTEDGNVVIGPKLDVVMAGKRVDVTGDVDVPEARLVKEKKKLASVEASRDVVFVGVPHEPPKTTAEIHARVRVVLGDRVSFKGQGFDTKIEGTLLAVDEPGRATTGAGELRLVEGTYKAYGQDLMIERGRAVFAGPIDDPALDAQAYRKANDGTVAGIVIKGTLRAPEVTLYSDPAMSQSEALAYLLLGHPLGQSSEKEGSLVANAAASLGLKGGNMLAKKIATRLGLEEAKIEAKDGYQSASLVVAKYFSPKFYVQYGIGLFDRVSTVRINYVLNKKWTLRAETGTGNAADILYTVDSRAR